MPVNDFDTRFGDPAVAAGMARRFPQFHGAARDFWNTALADGALTQRMRELVLLAIFASPAGYDQPMVDAQLERAEAAGASPEDIVDVLISVAGIANHALYMAVPLAEEHFPPDEITAGIDARALASAAATKEEFIRTRGFWNKERDVLARAMPDYFLASGEFSMTATKSGSLSIKEREMIFLSIDASVNHMSEPGLDIHYRNARKAGLTFREVAAVLKIVGVVGLLSYINSAPRLTR